MQHPGVPGSVAGYQPGSSACGWPWAVVTEPWLLPGIGCWPNIAGLPTLVLRALSRELPLRGVVPRLSRGGLLVRTGLVTSLGGGQPPGSADWRRVLDPVFSRRAAVSHPQEGPPSKRGGAPRAGSPLSQACCGLGSCQKGPWPLSVWGPERIMPEVGGSVDLGRLPSPGRGALP